MQVLCAIENATGSMRSGKCTDLQYLKIELRCTCANK